MTTYTITDKGRNVIEDMVKRFGAGENVEDIASSYNLAPEAVRVLMGMEYFADEHGNITVEDE